MTSVDRTVTRLPLSTPLPAGVDEAFERFARLVRHQLGVPVALVSLVDENRQVLPGAIGLPEPWATTRWTPLTHSFCQHVVTSREPLVITDARLEPLVQRNLAIPDLGVVGYAGIPLVDVDGVVIGSLCAIDVEPREWTPLELDVLTDLAAACSSELQLRQLRRRAEQAAIALAERARQSRWLLHSSSVLNRATTTAEVAAVVSRLAGEGFGADAAVLTLHSEHAPAEHDPGALVGDLHLPLDLGADASGVLSLGWPVARDLDHDTATTAEAFAGFVSQSLLRATLLEGRRSAAETLQLAMLTDLPAPAHLELAARYLPAADEQVGGDWYDALITPDGTTVLAIGDVTGHDMAAAAAMGQLRTLLRGLAHDREEPPASTLRRLDSTAAGLQVGSLATVVVARVETGRRLRWSNAGHPPPVLLHADGRAELLTTRPELLLGLDMDVARTDHVVDLPPGSTVLLYTDGLVESRAADLDAGTDLLLEALTRRRDEPLDALLDGLLDDLAHSRDDDIALLAVRTRVD